MKLIIYSDEYWIKDVKLPSEFDSMNDYEKWHYIWNNNLLHREDGPAVIYSNGSEWYLNGRCHRIDGPAKIWLNGYKEWYLNDIEVDGGIYKKIQNSSKEELLVYMIDSEYKDYLPLIEYGLNQ